MAYHFESIELGSQPAIPSQPFGRLIPVRPKHRLHGPIRRDEAYQAEARF